jgi:hypothetical protein
MNIRRGLFRFWILGTILWAGICLHQTYTAWNETSEAQAYVLPNATAESYKLDNPFDQFDDKIAKAHYA